MFALYSRKIFVFALVLVGLSLVYLVSQAILEQRVREPLEGAGRLVEVGSNGVADAPEAPDAEVDAGAAEKETEVAMTASYYGYALAGLPTASGEPFDPEAHTAAHKSLPLGTELLVKRDGESVRVVVNDRGPYVAGRDLDLSQGAAEKIGLIGPGEDEVEVVLV